MPSSRIPSPARSQGARATPRRYKPRASRSQGSPARSTSSVKLIDVVKSCLEPFVLSPMPTRRSILPDTSDIDVPTRKSWWKRLSDDTRDVMDMVNTRDPELNKKAIEDIIEVEVLSQEQKEYTFDLPESSDNESISSIVIPQRKLFTQKDICPVTKYGQIVDLRGSPSKKQESQIVDDRTLNVGRKNLFNQGAKARSKPIFPLLNISADKTLTNKTKELPAKEPKAGTRNLFGNQPNQKRKNMFTNFVMSDSDESEILEIQPKVFGFPKNQEQERKDTSKLNREPSPSNSMDIELDDWQLLPSSTMVEQQIEDGLLNTPSKRARLGKLSDITKTNNTTANKTRQSNRSMNAKNKSANSLMLKEAEVNELVVPSHEELNHSAVNQNSTRRSLRNKDVSVKNVSLRNISKTNDNSKSKKSTKTSVVTKAVVESTDQKIEESKNKSNRSKTSKTMSKFDQALQSDDDNDFTLEYDDEPVKDDGENKTIMENKTQNPHQNLKHARISSSNNTSKLQTDASEKSQQITEVTSKTMQPENYRQKEPLEDIFSKENPHTTINKTIGDNITHNRSQNKASKNQNEANKSNRLTITKVLSGDQEIVNEKQDNTKHSEDGDDGGVQDHIETENNGADAKNSTQSIRQEIEHDEDKITKDNPEVSEAVGDAQEANNQNVSNEVDSDEGENIEENHEENAAESEEEQEQNESERNTTQENENEDEGSEKENHEESQIEDEEQADESEHDVSQEIENDDEEIEEDNQDDAEAEEENQQTTNESEKNVSQEMENNDDEMQEENENNDDSDEDEQQTNVNEQNISQAIENDEEESQEENEDESMAVEEEQEENENESIAVDEEQEENENEDTAVEEDEEENESAQYNTSVEEDIGNENEDNDNEEMDQESDSQNQSHEVDNDNDMDDNGNGSDDVDGIPDTEAANATHDTTGKHRQKPVKVASPEVVLHDKTNEMTSFSVQGRNTSIRKTKSLIKPSIKPSMAPVRESTGFSDGMGNSSAEGSGWDSHRTTRTTLRKTFGKDFTLRKSLRALVMEKSAKRQTNIDISRFPQANSTELPTDGQFEMEIDYDEETPESDHEVSRRTRQTTLEMYLDKIKDENLERRKQMREKIQNDLRAFRDEHRRPNILDPFKVPAVPKLRRVKAQPKAKAKAQKSTISRDMLPAEILQDMKYKPPKRFRPANASWITKRLYKYLETKLEPKYDYKARVRAEKLVETIYNFTKDIRRQPAAPPDAVNVLKHEMARLDIVRTHNDFYEFFYEYMPREVRVKVVPDVINKIPVPKHVFSDIIR